jgi:hypothetical protein
MQGVSLKRLLYLLVVCSRGRFLTTSPELSQRGGEGGLLCAFTMPWFENRSTTALATHLAHLVELKLWREYICSTQVSRSAVFYVASSDWLVQTGAVAGLPRPRFTEPQGCAAKSLPEAPQERQAQK